MKVLEKKDNHKACGSIGAPGRSGYFVSRRLKCPNCGSILQTEPGEQYGHCTLCDMDGRKFNIWITECPNCGYDKLAFPDKHGN